MSSVIKWLEDIFAAIPLPFMEIWGRFGFLLGLILMALAFGGFTFRPGGLWKLGLARQRWDTRALLSFVVTFILIFLTGYIGSFIVLVPGAQTFESLKDLAVFLCILLFGFPALIAVPFAYGLSDLVEGVPPDFLADWLVGYFINPACFWIAHQFIGKNPDFRKGRVWAWYLLFVVIFMSIEPQLWGYICSGKFTSEISFRAITPALFFTTAITWIMAPFVMLGALPLARKLNVFWAEIPNHVKERVIGRKEWIWESGLPVESKDTSLTRQGLPIRMLLVAPFTVVVLITAAATAYFTLQNSENSSNKLAAHLLEEISENIRFRLDNFLETNPDANHGMSELLKDLMIPKHGRAFIIDQTGKLMTGADDSVVRNAIENLNQKSNLMDLNSAIQFQFDIVTQKPLSRATWMAQAMPYQDKAWILVTALPEAFYMDAVRKGNSQSAMVAALALLISIGIAAVLATVVTNPIRRLSRAAEGLALGDLSQRVPKSGLEESDTLSNSFNKMAEQLKNIIDQLKASESRLHLAIKAAHLAIWDWDIEKNIVEWDDSMYELYGLKLKEFSGTLDAWTKSLLPEDAEMAKASIAAALRGEREFDAEFRVLWKDGTVHHIKGIAKTIRDNDGKPLRMVGVNYDITDKRQAEESLLQYRDHLEDVVAERTSDLVRKTAQLEDAVDELKRVQEELIDAKGRAEAADRLKSAFLATMSHELRTPLNSILGFTGLILQELPGPLNPEQRKQMAMIQSSSHHLLALINDVLDISKIEAGQMNVVRQPFDLRASLEKVVGALRPLAEKKGLQLNLKIGEAVERMQGDERRVEQIAMNLLSNAIKFTERGRIDMSCEKRGHEIEIVVRDTGIGIHVEDMEILFRPFQQVENGLARRYEGTGLGLSISRKLAELMGGTIRATSIPDQGSTFTFVLPAQ